jgi:hypothetical protein
MYNLSLGDNINFDWIKFVTDVLDNCGYTYVWETQHFITDLWLKQVIKLDFKINSDNVGYLQFIVRHKV